MNFPHSFVIDRLTTNIKLKNRLNRKLQPFTSATDSVQAIRIVNPFLCSSGERWRSKHTSTTVKFISETSALTVRVVHEIIWGPLSTQ